MNIKYLIPLLAALTFGCGDKDEDTGAEDTFAPSDSGDTADTGDTGDTADTGE